MSDSWAIVAAGLGGSLITGAVSLLIVERTAAHQRRAQQRRERRKAYSELLGYSAMALQGIQAMHLTMAVRSGLTEGLDVNLRLREPIDPLKLWETMRADHGPLILAWSEVWAVGSREGVEAANRLIDRCAAVTSSGTTRGEARGRISRALAGEKWTQDQLDSWARDERAVAEARRELALLARRELGVEVAEVFVATPAEITE